MGPRCAVGGVFTRRALSQSPLQKVQTHGKGLVKTITYTGRSFPFLAWRALTRFHPRKVEDTWQTSVRIPEKENFSPHAHVMVFMRTSLPCVSTFRRGKMWRHQPSRPGFIQKPSPCLDFVTTLRGYGKRGPCPLPYAGVYLHRLSRDIRSHHVS